MSDRVFSGHQPNFLPYMGFFYKMFRSDVFILDDDVQYSSKAWHNTNFIKAGQDKYRLTVPVSYTFGDPINKVEISYAKPWDKKLLSTLRMSYGKAPFFEEGFSLIERHISKHPQKLVDLTIPLIREVHDLFGLGCEIVLSHTMPTELRNNERNIWQCEQLGCNIYYSGIGGREYNDAAAYAAHGIRLEYSDYGPTPYRQVGKGAFIENLSVIDYIFNKGFVLPEEWVRE